MSSATDRNTRYRSKQPQRKVIAFSIAWSRGNSLARGVGLEHLKELLLRMARPVLRNGNSIAFSGHLKETEDNFTFELLRLISAEQEDSMFATTTVAPSGILYNHLAWPQDWDLTPAVEARWINCCRSVRITQEMAGIAPGWIWEKEKHKDDLMHKRFNTAVALSAMRRLSMAPVHQSIPGLPARTDVIPGADARIVLGGRDFGYSGFLPGIFEEALISLERKSPLFLLGGFGGASEVLAQIILYKDAEALQKLDFNWQVKQTPALADLLEHARKNKRSLPAGIPSPRAALSKLKQLLIKAHASPAKVLNTGLDDDDTRTLMRTADVHTAVRLVKKGLLNLNILSELPS